MSEIVVRAENLTKAYTLYSSSWDRMREILGFRRRPGVDFPRRGESRFIEATAPARARS